MPTARAARASRASRASRGIGVHAKVHADVVAQAPRGHRHAVALLHNDIGCACEQVASHVLDHLLSCHQSLALGFDAKHFYCITHWAISLDNVLSSSSAVHGSYQRPRSPVVGRRAIGWPWACHAWARRRRFETCRGKIYFYGLLMQQKAAEHQTHSGKTA